MADFRIEIPIDVTNNTDMGQLQQLESLLNKIYSALQKDKSAAQGVFDAAASGAGRAASSMQQVETAAEQTAQSLEESGSAAQQAGSEQQAAAQQAEQAEQQLEDSVSEVSDAFEESGDAAQQAGQQSGSAFNQAAGQVDQFTQRVEKSNRSLREAFREKLQLVMQALDKASPVLQKISNGVKNLTRKAWHVAVKLKDLVTAPFRALKNMIMSPIMMTLSIAGIGLGASSFYQTFSEFTAGMSNVKALSGATDAEFVKLTETAKELGATTKFTAAEASEGMQYLAMAGWETNEIIDAMPGLLQLAAAGATDLGTASDIVSDVMTAMGMSANEATRAADVFARTATSTNTTVANMGETLKYAAPAAKAFGMQLEDVATLTGMMANAGVKGSSAGTALRTALLRMASPTSDAAKAMKKLGITFDDGAGNMKDMKAIMRELGDAFSTLGNQEKLAMADDLFGKNASTAWLAVLDQGVEAYEKLSDSIYNSAGAAEEMANIQLDNLAGDVTLLQSAVDGMKISLMDKLDPYLRSAVQWITAKIPDITEKLGNLIDKGISKAKELKDYIVGVFNSSEMQNAESFADKLFIAWDKIIAEPFNNWWNGSGREFVLGIMKKIGTSFGEVLHGIVAGIFAALKGEEIDFEGLNLTGIAKAGAEAAKEYVGSFAKGLDAGSLIGAIPGGIKAGLLGIGALKLGSGIYHGYKDITFSGLGSALAAIPGWGWAALAVLVALGVGIKLYNDHQERERQALLHLSDDVNEAADNYVKAAKKAQEVRGTFDQIHEIEVKIEEGGKNEETVKKVREEIDNITDRTVWLEARLANTTLTPAEIEAYKQELEKVKDRKAYLEAALASGTLTATQVETYQKELDKLNGKEVELEAALASGTLTATDIATYQAELDALHGNHVELEATLKKEGYSVAEVALIEAQLAMFQEGQKKATVMIANNSDLTPDEVQSYVTRLGEIATAKAEAEVKIEGAGKTPTEIAAYSTQLKKIKDRKAEIEVKMAEGEGSMSPTEWENLVSEYTSLTSEEAKISLLIDGSKLDETQLNDLKTKVETLKDEAANILLQISENSDLSEDDMNELARIFQDFGDMNVLLNFGLSAGSLTKEDLEQYNQQLKDLYGNISELTGGAFSQEDLESGAVTQEDVEAYVLADAAASRQELAEAIQTAEYKAPDAIEKRDQYRSEYEAKATDIENATAAMNSLKTMQRESDALQAERRMNVEAMKHGDMSYEDYTKWQTETYEPAIDAMAEKWNTDIAPKLETSEGYNMTGTEAPTAWDFEELGGFAGAIADLENYISDETPKLEKSQANYEQQNQALVDLYQGKKGLVEADAFGQDVRYAGNSLEEMAAQYATLDDAGKQMFENAIMGLAELNASTDYITDAEKTSTEAITQQAVQSAEAQANVDVVAGIQKQLMEMSNTYQKLGDAGKEAWNTGDLERLNSELADLNLEPLESLDTASIEALQSVLTSLGTDVDLSSVTDMGEALNTAMEAIEGIDTETIQNLNFDTAASSLETLGGNADDARAKVDTVKTAMDTLNAATADSTASSVSGVGTAASGAKSQVSGLESEVKNLDGMTATFTINIKKNGSVPKGAQIATLAEGGIYDGAFLSWVAEDGPEAIIPLGAKRRSRGLDLWLQAGEALGVNEFAEGGIMAPYSGLINSLPEDSWSDDGNGSGDYKPTGNGGTGGSIVQVNVDVNPEYKIEGTGGDPDAILDAIRAHQNELAELLGAAMADQLEDIITNM